MAFTKVYLVLKKLAGKSLFNNASDNVVFIVKNTNRTIVGGDD